MNEQYNISFIKNFGHNQMCIEPICSSDSYDSTNLYIKDYRIKMVCNNSIDGLLNTHMQYVNNIPSFCYDISGLQSLSITLENTPLDYELLTRIIYEIYNLIFSCEKYMLDTDKLLLEPEYIFLCSNNSSVKICYLPLKTTDFTSSMRKLFDYFLRHIDHSDEKCVYTAYSIHNHCVTGSITPSILISYINKHNNVHSTNVDSTNVNSININTPNKDSYTSTYKPVKRNISENVTMNNAENIFQKTSTNKNFSSSLIVKSCILIASFFIGLIFILSLYIFKTIDLPLLIILILILITSCLIIGYNLYSNLEGPILAISKHDITPDNNSNFYVEDSGSTILLSSIENNDSHMLIYTGSDMNSQATLSHYPFTIGKDTNCDLVLPNPIISRLHCRINCYVDDNNSIIYYVEDLNSTNGTFLNNTPITPYKKYNLKSGDNISFGHLTYIFR